MKKTHAVAIRMDPEIKTRLEELAKADNRSLSSYVGLLLMRHVEEQGRKSKR
jgi:predicted DNA-binding protein